MSFFTPEQPCTRNLEIKRRGPTGNAARDVLKRYMDSLYALIYSGNTAISQETLAASRSEYCAAQEARHRIVSGRATVAEYADLIARAKTF